MVFVLLLGLLGVVGYGLGIAGFFRANSAHAELRALRRTLSELAARAPDAAAPNAAAPNAAAPGAAAPDGAATDVAATDVAVGPGPDVAPALSPAAQNAVPAEQPAASAQRIPVKPRRDLETQIAARWGVWLGAAALLLAGVFLIRYAVEQALLGPAARCAAAAVLAALLLAGAEWLRRHEPSAIPGPLDADQAPAGLAAGGCAILFGAAYGAGPYYDLLPYWAGFIAMAAASFIGLAAALRFGPLTAAVGIAGGFATPALVASQNPSWPGLFAYLAVVTAASLATVRYTAWTWLGWAATAGACAWICLASVSGGADLWAAAAFVPVAAALNLALLPAAALDHRMGRRLAWVPFTAIAASGLLLETQDPNTAPRIALFLLSPLAVWRGIAEPRQDRLPWIGALAGLLTLLLWALPEWHPTGETITVEGIVEAVLPGPWAPEAIRPFLGFAALLATFHAAAGLWRERRAPHPLPWSALAAAVPVLALLVSYAQIARFQSDAVWALTAAALAAALTGTAARAAGETAVDEGNRETSRQRAGVHAAGAAAALALGCAMILHDQWLTLAVALFLPALAWIEAKADLPPLRPVALAVACVVLARLVLNWYVLDYAFGRAPLANGLIAAYAVPAALFALAARLFRRRANDTLVATLEAGAVTLLALFVALELRHGFGGGQLEQPFGFPEIALHQATLSVQAAAYLYVARRSGRPVPLWAARLLGGAALGLGWLLIVLNPMLTNDPATVATLAAAYLVPAALASVAVRDGLARRWPGFYAVAAGFAWITLQIRQLFHPSHMGVLSGPIGDAELWAWSGGWLVYGIALMVLGIRFGRRRLRLAALCVIGLVCAKVFLIDMSDLTGLWRVLSFLGLGLALIGLGVVHRRFVAAPGSGGVAE